MLMVSLKIILDILLTFTPKPSFILLNKGQEKPSNSVNDVTDISICENQTLSL